MDEFRIADPAPGSGADVDPRIDIVLMEVDRWERKPGRGDVQDGDKRGAWTTPKRNE